MPRIYLSNDASDVSGYKLAYVDMRSPATTAKTATATTTTASGDDIQVTDAAGGTALKWITKPLLAAATLVTAVHANLWCKETSAAANCGPAVNLYPYTSGSEGSVFLDDDAYQTEITTSIAAVRYTTVAASSTILAAGDRLVIKVFVSNAGLTMGAVTGGFVFDYDGPTAGADGDSWIDILEDFRVSETQVFNGALPFKAGFSTGLLVGMQGAFQRGIDAGLYTADAKVRSALDSIQYELNLQSPRSSLSTPA